MNGEAELGANLDSKVFPRITVIIVYFKLFNKNSIDFIEKKVCDVKTRELGTLHTYSIQVVSFNSIKLGI